MEKGQARTCNCIIKLLKEVEEASFQKIKEHVNSKMKHGVTSQRLANVLRTYPEFELVGMTGYKKDKSGYMQTLTIQSQFGN